MSEQILERWLNFNGAKFFPKTSIETVYDNNGTPLNELLYPIGMIYLQLKGQSEPSTLFGGTWENVSSNFAGEFFRAEGGNAVAFGSSQAEGLPNIAGSFTIRNSQYDSGNAFPIENEFIKVENSTYTGADGFVQVTSAPHTQKIVFDANSYNSIYGNSSHVTPVNSTIRIWKRTA